MKTMLKIARQELKAYFVTPIAYVYLTTFLILTSWLFFKSFFIEGQNHLRNFFTLMPWIFLFFVPAVAMGKWSEEKKQGSIEILFTLPITKMEIIAGKFLAGLGLIVIAAILTFPLPLTLAFLGEVDWGAIIGGYLGLLFLGGVYLSLSLWLSAFTQNQIVAFILGVIVSFLFLIIGEPIVTTSAPSSLIPILQYLGLGHHFESIGRGVLDSRDIFYYLSIIGIALYLNRQALEKTKDRWMIIFTLFIGISTLHLLSARHFLRCDLTQTKMFSLSQPTKALLKKLDDIVTIRVYFSPNLPPALTGLKNQVDDLLSEFKNNSHGHVKLEYYNPQENPIQEQKIKMMGIPPVEINIIQKDKNELARIYLGIAISYGAKQEVLPVVQNTRNLEYQLVAALLKTTQEQQPSLGWWVPATQNQSGYQMVKAELEKRYALHSIDSDSLKELDVKKIPTLFVIAPSSFKPEEKKTLKQYLNAGGKTLLLLQLAEVSMERGLKIISKNDDFNDLLKTYGLKIEDTLVLDSSSATAIFTGGAVNYQLPYPYWVQVRPDGFNSEIPFVAELNNLVFPWISPISIEEIQPDVKVVAPLFVSSNDAVSTPFQIDTPLDPASTRDALGQGQAGQYMLGAMATDTTHGTQLILVANSYFLQNGFLQQFPQNISFVENVIDILSNQDMFINIRTKGNWQQPIRILSDGEKQFVKYTDILMGPILTGLFGLLFLWRRKIKIQKFKKALV